MEPAQAFVLFLTFACALGGLLLAFRVERRVTKMFGKGNLKEAMLQFFSGKQDAEGNEIPPDIALYQFTSQVAQDCTAMVLRDLPGALVSLKGKNFAKKAAKSSHFAQGAQNLTAGGFGELNGLKEIGMELFSKVGTGGKGGGMMEYAPMIMQFLQSQSKDNQGNGAPGSLPHSQQSQSLPSLGKPM